MGSVAVGKLDRLKPANYFLVDFLAVVFLAAVFAVEDFLALEPPVLLPLVFFVAIVVLLLVQEQRVQKIYPRITETPKMKQDKLVLFFQL